MCSQLSSVQLLKKEYTVNRVKVPQLCLWDSPGKNTGVGSHCLLQGIFPTRTEPRSPALRADSFPAEMLGKPKKEDECVILQHECVILSWLLLSSERCEF